MIKLDAEEKKEKINILEEIKLDLCCIRGELESPDIAKKINNILRNINEIREDIEKNF